VSGGSASGPIVVRDARADEYEAVGRLTLHAYEDAGILGTDPGYRKALLEAAPRAVPPGRVLVAVDQHDRLLGAVAYCPSGSRFAEVSRPDEAEFRMLAVGPEHRGAGAARALVDACRDAARGDRRARLVLSVIDHNVAAAAMYERLGFHRAPDRDWEPVPGVLLRVWQQEVLPVPTWCERCGGPAGDGDHAACLHALTLEPPRYCPRCRRRMVVQVLPAGWTARCSEHGTTPGPVTA
jgi:ribosomal protein S18 acetylase RimI-like enzyme